MQGQVMHGPMNSPGFLDIGKRVLLCRLPVHWRPASMPAASQGHNRRVVAQLEMENEGHVSDPDSELVGSHAK